MKSLGILEMDNGTVKYLGALCCRRIQDVVKITYDIQKGVMSDHDC